MRAFLSHSSADKESYVRLVAKRLSEESIIIDEVSFEAGELTLSEIIQGLDDSTLFVLFISGNSLASSWVQDEIRQAELRLASGELKAVYPIIIDRDVNFKDPRIPEWLRESYNLKLVSRPAVAARRIQQKLRQLSWSRHPMLQERQKLFVGRNSSIEAFERRFDDFSKSKPTLSIVGGHSSIGRRTLIRNALAKLSLAKFESDCPIIYMDRHASIEDFILRLLDLGLSEDNYVDLKLLELTLDEKVKLATSLLEDLLPLRERVIILDEGSLVNYTKELAGWFQSIVRSAELAGRPILFVASRWALDHKFARALDREVFSTSLGELDDSERRRLLARLLEIENISVSDSDFETFGSLLHGFPDEVYFAVDLISRFGVSGAIDRSHEIIEFNAEKASTLLRKFEGNHVALNVIRLLAQSEIFSVQFLGHVFKEEGLSEIIAELVAEHLCELVGVEGEFVRLIDSVRDHVKRNKLELTRSSRQLFALQWLGTLRKADSTSTTRPE